jgi:hypothetical protein
MPRKPKPPAPPRIGRPPRAGVAADRRFEMRVTQTEIDAWTKAAGDQPVGAWAREAINRAAKRTS